MKKLNNFRKKIKISFCLFVFLFALTTSGFSQSHTFPTVAGPVNLASGTVSRVDLPVNLVPAGKYYFFKVEADWSMGASNTAWSQSIQVGFDDGSNLGNISGYPSTYKIFDASETGQTGAVNGPASVTLNWTGIFRSEYDAGTNLDLLFDDGFTSGGPFNSVLTNIKVTIYQLPTSGGGAGDNLGNHTATMDLNMSSNKITNVTNPTADQDAATKKYVDDEIAASAASVSASLENASLGTNALGMNTTGEQNSAVGTSALSMNTAGSGNAAFGANSLLNNTTGNRNVALGREALQNNTSGNNNVAVGNRAMLNNTDGGQNTAVGNYSLQNIDGGNYNTGIGYESLRFGTDGSFNIGIGYRAMVNNDGGSYNASIGFGALKDNVTGSNNTGIGRGADVTMDNLTNATAIGSNAKVAASSSIRFGNTAITNIEGQVNFTAVSDRKFKTNIERSSLGLDFITQLRPVTYNMKDHGDIQYTGFIAQEVDELVRKIGTQWSGVKRPANETDHFGLRYAEFTVPLVNAVQEMNVTDEELKKENELLKTEIEELNTKNEELENRLERIEKLLFQKSASTQNLELTLQGNSKQAELLQNIPNPFISNTLIKAFIPQDVQNARLVITDINGKVLLEEVIAERGSINTTINAKNLANGNYIYSLILDDKLLASKTMILTK